MYVCKGKTNKGLRCRNKVKKSGTKCHLHLKKMAAKNTKVVKNTNAKLKKKRRRISWKSPLTAVKATRSDPIAVASRKSIEKEGPKKERDQYDTCASYMGEDYGIWESSDYTNFLQTKKYKKLDRNEKEWIRDCAEMLNY